MAFLLAIEGADGAGKATVAAATAQALRRRGLRAETVSFPRYTATVGGHALGELLAGRLPLAATPEAAAVLYALDRFESKGFLAEVAGANDVIVFDRYIASNIVYQAAKVPADRAPALSEWIVAMETGQFGLPLPDLSIYLDTPLAVSRRLIAQKAQRSYTTRTFDENEADDALQRRVREGYEALAAAGAFGRWHRVPTIVRGEAGDTLRPPADLAAAVVAAYELTA
jgi:dTMP kinase